MCMKKLLAAAIAALLCLNSTADENTGWLRKSSISPDGQTVAFAYQGDIWTVPVAGGAARQLTTNSAYDSDPIWTADGSAVVFSSYREIGKDIWSVSAEGGTPKRLTSYTGAETPLATTPDGYVIFQANIQVDKDYIGWYRNPQTYKVSAAGGKISRLLPMEIEAASVNEAGDILYEDYKGVEDALRKHHTSSVTHDIWMRKASDGTFTKLSDYVGENRNPVFAADGDTFYFLSEQSGNFNIWKSSVSKPSEKKQISFFETHPVRYVSVASEGTLLFSWNGSLYTMKEGSGPVKLEITVSKDKNEREHVYQSASASNSVAASPNGKEVAMVSRGDVYITSIEYRTAKRITATPEQERGISFSKDGRTIYYASERDGEWGIYKTSLTDKKDKFFTYSFAMKEERVTQKGQTCFQPSVSPDGQWLAFLRDRTTLVVKNLKSGKEKVLLEGVNYSYTDGDQEFEWNPDSHHIACTYMIDGGWNNPDIAVIDIDSGEITNVTRSGYSDENFRWALGGKALTWETDKNGYRSHGSWGTESDIYILFFDGKEFAKFREDEELVALDKIMKEGDKKAEKQEKKDSLKQEKHEKLTLDFENAEDRTLRLTGTAGRVGDQYLSPDGKKLIFTSRAPEGTGLYVMDTQKKSLKLIKRGLFGSFTPSPDGKSIYIAGLLGTSKFDIASEKSTSITMSEEYEYDAAAERAYIFDHCWKQVDEKFYDASIHGIDWKAYGENYRQFLPYIKNNFVFRELLSEMLGELNGSHTGARYSAGGSLNCGHLGVLFDENWEGKGLKIAEILPGSVLAQEDPEIREGDVILAINTEEIPEGSLWYEVLKRKAGKRLLLTIQKGGKREDIYVKPSSSDDTALYQRWVRRNEQMVRKLSGGKVGYVHVKAMDSPSFREVFSRALGKFRGCEALIVDSRNNGGGWLTDDLCTFLSGKKYIDHCPRGQYIGSEPFAKWTKPSCVVMGENNYSDASGFPYAYRTLGIGKLIGAPVPGTMTAVWWETQVDASLVFGIPQVTSIGVEGRPLENFQIEPDILVYNDPQSLMEGRDLQLEAAVKEMLEEISK